MTVYFDEALHQTLELRHTPGEDAMYIAAMAAIEQPIVRDVLPFHTLAMRRITTRFGHWTDSPLDNLLARRRHDEGGA